MSSKCKGGLEEVCFFLKLKTMKEKLKGGLNKHFLESKQVRQQGKWLWRPTTSTKKPQKREFSCKKPLKQKQRLLFVFEKKQENQRCFLTVFFFCKKTPRPLPLRQGAGTKSSPKSRFSAAASKGSLRRVLDGTKTGSFKFFFFFFKKTEKKNKL